MVDKIEKATNKNKSLKYLIIILLIPILIWIFYFIFLVINGYINDLLNPLIIFSIIILCIFLLLPVSCFQYYIQKKDVKTQKIIVTIGALLSFLIGFLFIYLYLILFFDWMVLIFSFCFFLTGIFTVVYQEVYFPVGI